MKASSKFKIRAMLPDLEVYSNVVAYAPSAMPDLPIRITLMGLTVSGENKHSYPELEIRMSIEEAVNFSRALISSIGVSSLRPHL